ncbi:hypothetical protein GCM10010498_00130 [Streptomyces cavourensis]|nr:hypothetical protein GCM10010498_00130 [Streptomyces cavourensis]
MQRIVPRRFTPRGRSSAQGEIRAAGGLTLLPIGPAVPVGPKALPTPRGVFRRFVIWESPQ